MSNQNSKGIAVNIPDKISSGRLQGSMPTFRNPPPPPPPPAKKTSK